MSRTAKIVYMPLMTIVVLLLGLLGFYFLAPTPPLPSFLPQSVGQSEGVVTASQPLIYVAGRPVELTFLTEAVVVDEDLTIEQSIRIRSGIRSASTKYVTLEVRRVPLKSGCRYEFGLSDVTSFRLASGWLEKPDPCSFKDFKDFLERLTRPEGVRAVTEEGKNYVGLVVMAAKVLLGFLEG